MWPVILAIAAVLFLITGNPLIAAVLPYLRAAWPAVQSAIWLRSADPVVERGRACLWFYLATAGWRAAATALVVILLCVACEIVAGVKPDMDLFARTMIALMGGLAVATVLGAVGLVSAQIGKVRVFVIPDVHHRCRGDFSVIAEVAATRPHFNHAIFVLASSLFVPILAIAGMASVVSFGGENPNKLSLLTLCATAGVLIAPLATIPLYIYLSRRVIAPTPFHCWGEYSRVGQQPKG